MDLKCRKLDCKHNKEYACCCNSINIKDNCDCGTYEKSNNLDETQRQDASKNMFEIAPEVHPYRHNKDIDINCQSKECLFNKNCKCQSNGICVNSENNEASCITFIEK